MSDICLEAPATLKKTYMAGDLESCLSLATQLLRDNPSSLAPLQYAARVHSKRRETQLAKPFWNKLTILNPELPEPFLQSARIARLEKDWAQCERYIAAFIHQTPDHAEALGLQIQCYLEAGDTTKTVRAIAALSHTHPDAVPPHAMRAAERGMGIEVAQALSHPANANDPSLTALCNRLARAARDAAIGFEIRKQPFAAANCYQAMQVYAPTAPYPTAALSRLCKPYLDKSQAAYAAKAYAEALKHAKTCLKISPEEAAAKAIVQRARTRLASAAPAGPA